MENNTLTYLYSKGRNRFAKVLYILFFAIFLCSFVYFFLDAFRPITNEYQQQWAIEDRWFYGKAIIITVIIFELIKKAFYYIALGTVKPKK